MNVDRFQQSMMQIVAFICEGQDASGGIRKGIPYLTIDNWPEFCSKGPAGFKLKDAKMYAIVEHIEDRLNSSDDFVPLNKEGATHRAWVYDFCMEKLLKNRTLS